MSGVFAPAPVVIGHRGAGVREVSGLAENTLASFREAHARGADWIELDARLTADGDLVLHHDAHLPDGRPIDELPVAEAVAAGLERLDDVLAGLPAGLGVDLEVKGSLADADADAAASTAGLVARRAAALLDERAVALTSFSPDALLDAAAVAPEVPTGLLAMPILSLRELVPAAAALGARVVAPHAISLGVVPEVRGLPVDPPERIAQAVAVADRLGIEVLAWGVEPERVGDLAARGVAAVCVDRIPEAVAAAGDRFRPTGAERSPTRR